jgi:hypothetical protein
MNLYIKVIDGAPYEHPILEENLLQVYGVIDTNTYIPFEKKPYTVDVYQVYEGTEYVIQEDGICKEVHHIRDMTDEERNEYDNLL